MDLETFITETIKSIIKGVNNTFEFANEHGAKINPLGKYNDKISATQMFDERMQIKTTVTKIEFDVAVTASNEEKNSVGGGLKIQVLNLGASSDNSITSQSSSKIKFEVNVVLPTHK